MSQKISEKKIIPSIGGGDIKFLIECKNNLCNQKYEVDGNASPCDTQCPICFSKNWDFANGTGIKSMRLYPILM